MLRFEGDKAFRQPPALVFSKLRDARFLVSCVPGVEAVAKAEPTLAVWTLRPGFTFARGTLELTLHILDIVPERSARIVAQSKGIGSTSEVEAALTLTPHDEGTGVHWTADVKSLGGLLKAVPQGLIKASAQKVIADIWTAVEAKLASI
jgi:carbon monoxide dehydrogenase subunit G